jgi:hypothetical protein
LLDRRDYREAELALRCLPNFFQCRLLAFGTHGG